MTTHYAFGQFPERPLCVAYGARMSQVFKWPMTKVPSEVTCRNCKRTFQFQWFIDDHKEPTS